MSTQSYVYIMLAVKLDTQEEKKRFSDSDDASEAMYEFYDPYSDQPREKKIGEKNGITAILPCVGGNDMYIGKVLGRSDEYGDLDDIEGMSLDDCKLAFPSLSYSLLEEFPERKFGHPKLYAFTHVR